MMHYDVTHYCQNLRWTIDLQGCSVNLWFWWMIILWNPERSVIQELNFCCCKIQTPALNHLQSTDKFHNLGQMKINTDTAYLVSIFSRSH